MPDILGASAIQSLIALFFALTVLALLVLFAIDTIKRGRK